MKGIVLALTSGLWLLAPGSGLQTLKVDVNLVNIFATVKDGENKFVTNLSREDFRIFEDDQPQEIRIFEKQDRVESSIGILMDTSGSMVDILPPMRTGVHDFVRGLSRSDRVFVFDFGTNVRLLHDSSQSPKHLDDAMQTMRAWGTSVLYDALIYAMDRIQSSNHPRKALIAFTDGNDNGSKAGYGEVVAEAQQSGALIYFVAIGSRILVDTRTLEDLSGITGGRTLYVEKRDALAPVLDPIRAELAQQYYLGYYAPRRPGFHRIRVEVPGRTVTVRAKSGYLGE